MIPGSLRRLTATRSARTAIVALATAAAAIVLAVVGALPSAAQRFVSDSAAKIGVDLPRPGDADDVDDGAAADDADQGEGDDAGEEADTPPDDGEAPGEPEDGGADDGAGQPEGMKLFVAAVKEWTACVSQSMSNREGDKEKGLTPHEACGAHPHPQDFKGETEPQPVEPAPVEPAPEVDQAPPADLPEAAQTPGPSSSKGDNGHREGGGNSGGGHGNAGGGGNGRGNGRGG